MDVGGGLVAGIPCGSGSILARQRPVEGRKTAQELQPPCFNMGNTPMLGSLLLGVALASGAVLANQ